MSRLSTNRHCWFGDASQAASTTAAPARISRPTTQRLYAGMRSTPRSRSVLLKRSSRFQMSRLQVCTTSALVTFTRSRWPGISRHNPRASSSGACASTNTPSSSGLSWVKAGVEVIANRIDIAAQAADLFQDNFSLRLDLEIAIRPFPLQRETHPAPTQQIFDAGR